MSRIRLSPESDNKCCSSDNGKGRTKCQADRFYFNMHDVESLQHNLDMNKKDYKFG